MLSTVLGGLCYDSTGLVHVLYLYVSIFRITCVSFLPFFFFFLPVYLQQRSSAGVCDQSAEHISESLPAAQPDQDGRGRFDSVFQSDHALPFPRGQPHNVFLRVFAFVYAHKCRVRVCFSVGMKRMFEYSP